MEKFSGYGIITDNELLAETSSSHNQRTALLGQIVKIESFNPVSDTCSIRFLKDGETWEGTSFICPLSSLEIVDERYWNFLSAVASPKDRVKLAKDKKKITQLIQLTTDVIVGFNSDNTVYLGTIKLIGHVKGIGMCYGIRLHVRKKDNSCDGSCAGIQYFNCLPGYGVFTTAEKIIPDYWRNNSNNESEKHKDLDLLVQQNVARLSLPCINSVNSDSGKVHNKSNGMKSSPTSAHAKQNIDNSVNTTNDFDQNSILQPEDIYLLNNRHQNGTNGPPSGQKLSDFCNHFPVLNDDIISSYQAKQKNVNSYVNGSSKTGPKKFKSSLNNEKPLVKQTANSKFYVNNLELNERLELERKALPSTSSAQQEDVVVFYEPSTSETCDLTVGSMVEVLNDVSDSPLYGVVRWMGKESGSSFVVAGVELDEEPVDLQLTLSDGTYKGQRLIDCNAERVLFVPLSQCRKDSRFLDGVPTTPVHSFSDKHFGKDCPIIKGAVAPLIMKTEMDVEAICGKFRGIQGHHNSCYLDATLFAMFTYTAVFDNLLFRPRGPDDIDEYEEVQRVLREEIVNPLRTNLFVRADRVMNLRKLLDQLSSVSGLTSEEKDPEEFLNSLLAQILKADPFLKLNSGQDTYYYQLFVEKDDELKLPTVQQLFEQSFLTSNIKLKEVPSCLIVQMPRFGKNFKMYPRILPTQLLDVTDVIENSPRQCGVCGKLAELECRECYGQSGEEVLERTAFCEGCFQLTHRHSKTDHKAEPLSVPNDFLIISSHCPPSRVYMELFAVVCIETSHYVAFVKCGVGHEAPWCFFDSMADRKGELNGYNIPEIVACPDVSKWLSEEDVCRRLHENAPHDRYLPEHAKRLLCDAYICMYQSSDVMMYN